jgi:hypothetical protein
VDRHGTFGRASRGTAASKYARRDLERLSHTYAGIGARETPPATLREIEALALALARGGWTLRTGLSPGADQAFYKGSLAGDGSVELYLPWSGFEAPARAAEGSARVSVWERPDERAFALAERFHPGWRELDERERCLRARDCHEILGADLDRPVALVVCWTPDGSLDGSGPLAGGTGQALRLAHARGIPVFNLARRGHLRRAQALGAGSP